MTELTEEITKLKAELSQYELIQDDLKKEIAHLRHHIDNAQIFAVYQLVVDYANESFRVSLVSPSFREIVGVENPMNHDNWMAALHPDDLESMAAVHEKAFRETHRFEKIVRMYHPGKQEWRWHQFLATAKTDEDGEPKWVDGIVFDVTEQKRTELKILEYQKRLQDLSQRQFAGEERERRRIAEVLHDDVGQDLSLALFKMNQAREEQGELGPLLDEMAPLLEQAISNTRSITKELCPPALCQMGLKSGLEWLAARLEEQYRVQVIMDARGQFKDIDDDLGTLIFRTTAELLNNVAKHAKASKAEVNIERTDGLVRLSVIDDGAGFDYSSKSLHQSDGFGLFLLSERMRGIGGRLAIESSPGEGTCVSVDIPIA